MSKNKEPDIIVKEDADNDEVKGTLRGLGFKGKAVETDTEKVETPVVKQEDIIVLEDDVSITADELIDFVTVRESIPYHVCVPGKDPKTVRIRPVSSQTFHTLRKDYQMQVNVKGVQTSAEAKMAAKWIVAGTVEPPLKEAHVVKLMEAHPATVLDWAEAIQRLSGALEKIEWDDYKQELADQNFEEIKDLHANGIVESLKEYIGNDEIIKVIESASENFYISVRSVVERTLYQGEQLGRDKYRKGDIGAEPEDEVKND